MDKTLRIEGDALDVVKRIKALDRDYYVLFNLTKSRYEVHNRRQKGPGAAAVIPYKRLDARAVEYVRETRIERMKELVRQIEENNLRAAASSERQILDEAGYKAGQLRKYLSKGGSELPSYDRL